MGMYPDFTIWSSPSPPKRTSVELQPILPIPSNLHSQVSNDSVLVDDLFRSKQSSPFVAKAGRH
ncbi:MAG: hypothetical protein NPIRA03_26750 [Nitrospirales bacterium]|nr:MAG: hypothetical protein NPIRA03_26750 [Nitrospirales bacterium]